MSGALGGALVLAVAVVAVLAAKSPSGSGQAAGFTRSTSSASPKVSSAVKAAPVKASKTAKPTASAKASTTAKPTATAAAGAAAAPLTLTVPAGWRLAFDPGFSGSLDTSTWATCYDWAPSGAGCTNNPSIEKEWYLPSQVSVSGGTLNLTAKQEATQGVTNGVAKTYSCRSGMVTSKPGFNFTYGLVQITAKLPYGTGLWPALWLAATSDQWPPELDIMEHWYSEPQAKVYDHTIGSKYIGGPVPTPANLSAGFHTYS
ncbi:MAG: glycoside hydrolase family 16 protein, partial [Solirubrobacteraceae bacterium]